MFVCFCFQPQLPASLRWQMRTKGASITSQYASLSLLKEGNCGFSPQGFCVLGKPVLFFRLCLSSTFLGGSEHCLTGDLGGLALGSPFLTYHGSDLQLFPSFFQRWSLHICFPSVCCCRVSLEKGHRCLFHHFKTRSLLALFIFFALLIFKERVRERERNT